MPTLEELLRNSLNGANEKYDRANRDLHSAVTELAKAVQAVSEGRAKLVLVPFNRQEHSTSYNVDIRFADNSENRTLGKVTITSKGYPIQAEGLVENTTAINSHDELNGIFQRLASNPDSPLVTYLAYITRRPKN